jgi:hypothetical protein
MQLGEDPILVEVNTYLLSSVVQLGWAAACYGEHRKLRFRLGYRRDQKGILFMKSGDRRTIVPFPVSDSSRTVMLAGYTMIPLPPFL